LTRPSPVSPAQAAQIAFSQQPITLTVSTETPGVRPVSYVFSLDRLDFRDKRIPDDGLLPERRHELPASGDASAERTYYWRAKADDGANAATIPQRRSSGSTPVVIQAQYRSPLRRATVSTRKPTLVVSNATHRTAGDISYLFEVATDASMGNKVVSMPWPRAQNDESHGA
jgi:hypothetical protein